VQPDDEIDESTPRDEVARARLARAYYARDIAQYHATKFIAGIKIECQTDYDCPASRAAEGCYRIADAPEWPGERCTGEFGCICWWTAIFEDEEPPTPWKTGG